MKVKETVEFKMQNTIEEWCNRPENKNFRLYSNDINEWSADIHYTEKRTSTSCFGFSTQSKKYFDSTALRVELICSASDYNVVIAARQVQKQAISLAKLLSKKMRRKFNVAIDREKLEMLTIDDYGY